ncbi:hypothetical protein [uncultured Alistipes sp.]|jgi:hypothetical protein|uniref:hypothetical protein n=1 Tax=uncultured Alistipes sp. TaxID=538949 RepID=UPI0025FBA8BB|nr:hypothetical protein [uncultured Alistipes sp.]
MKFDIARQPLVPAFLTLFVLTIIVVCCGMETSSAERAGRTSAIMPLLGDLLNRFQSAYPLWSRLLSGFAILFTGMCIGRIGIRYNLYTVSSCLPIPLYAVIACGIFIGEYYLMAFTASMLFALAIKNYCRSFCSGYGFDASFRASFYLGLLPLVYAPSMPLVLIMPLALLLFQRTLREVVVSTAGLLLPVLTACYVSWGMGNGFTEPLFALYNATIAGSPLQLFSNIPMPSLAMLAGVVLLSLTAVFFFLTDFYAAGTKSRFILIFIIGVLTLTLALLFCPAATPEVFSLLAVPAATLIPVLFVRIHRVIALSIYILLLVATIVTITT